MTRDQWERVRDLFERAIESPPEDVGEWLRREAPDDADVHLEVASLLDHHTRAGAFIIEPVGERLPDLLAGLSHTFVPGQVVGNYTIVREAGRGGMGQVYVATDTRLGRTVAIKALPPEMTGSESERERLRREARAAASLTHPGICTVHALEEFDGGLFIVTEYVDGQTLREEMTDGRPPAPATVMATARELASALAAAHARNITHRDLKPENVMRTRDGRVKILDFGLARADGPDSDPLSVRVTQRAMAIGTPAYMAPEQLNGQAVDARADVFALGVLLYEYASGTHPFEAPNSLALISRVIGSEPVPIERLVPGIRAPLAQVIARCLQKRPGDRFHSAADVLHALTDGHAPVSLGEAHRWWRTHQAVVIALYFVAAGLAWQLKEWQPGVTLALFIAVSAAAATGGMLRGHLVFTERVNRPGLAEERARTAPITLGADLLLALALGAGGFLVAPTRPVAAVLTIALAVGVGLTRLVVEPATTRAAFAPDRGLR